MSDIPSSPRPARRRPKKQTPFGLFLKAFGILAAVVVVAVVGYVVYFLHVIEAPGSKHLPKIDPLNLPKIAQQFPNQQSINLMVIGRDYDYSNSDQVLKSSARADLLMMAKLDFANNQVKILSIPRDTKADIPGHPPSKINSAEEKGGPALTAATVLQNFNIPEDHYVAIDFDGFQKAVDEIGGVDLDVDKKMDYDDNWAGLHIHLLPGQQHLTGYQAMGFARFRHSDSDLVRTKRQQTLLAALKEKVDNPAVILPALPHLLVTINDSAASDLTDNQKIALAYWLRGVPKANIEMNTVPSVEGGYYVYTDWPKAAPIIKNWFGVDPPANVSMVTPTPVVEKHAHHRRIAKLS